jgi:hypothetical protein
VDPEGDVEPASGPKQTVLRLDGFDRKYAEVAPKSARIIAIGLLEHCLWYFVRRLRREGGGISGTAAPSR